MLGRAYARQFTRARTSYDCGDVSSLRGNGGLASQAGVPTAASHANRTDVLSRPSSSGTIEHVVIIIQENRSFNNLFYNYPGATTQSYGYNSHGKKIALAPVTLATKWDLQHDAQGFITSCNGTGSIPGTDCRMNGFNKETWTCGTGPEPACPDRYPPYSYVPHDQVQPYLDMAHQYVLADEMFASDFDVSSFVSHQYTIAGVNPKASVDYPDGDAWGYPGGPPGQIAILGENRKFPDGTEEPCWDPTTLADELDSAGVSWSFYASKVRTRGSFNCGTSKRRSDSSLGRTGIWSAYQAINHICYGADWKNVITPPSQFLTDVSNGKLSAVTWITPTFANSDHSGSDSATRPSWVTSLVNAVGESKF